MKKFLNARMDELNVAQTLMFTAIITVVSFAPFAIIMGVVSVKEKLEERRNMKEE